MAWSQAVPAPKTPALALPNPAEAGQWEAWANEAGWKVIVPAGAAGTPIDGRVLALATAVKAAIQDGSVDPDRIYLAGRGDGTSEVIYTISRIPDLWAAGIGLGGSPQPALDTGRIFAANFTNTPVLWVSATAADQARADALRKGGVNLEWRTATGLTNAAVFEWLSRHVRNPFPAAVDCETNSPTFASCYWLQPGKFDPGERNDVLPSSRVLGGSGASLDLGAFGYKLDDPGPGLLISFLPEKYSGPLKMGDRILAMDGKPIESPQRFAEMMNQIVEEKNTVVMIQRGKSTSRLETRIVLPHRDSGVTARVQGKYEAAENQLMIVSRTVKEMRVTIPEQWVGAGLFWNGLGLEKLERSGCILLTMDKELLHAAACN